MRVLLALAAAALVAVDFGPPEPVESGHGIAEFRYYGEQVGVDSAGTAYIGAKLTVDDGEDVDEQAMVLRRCGTIWSQTVVAGSPDYLSHAHDLAVASGGSAVLVWSDEHSSASHFLYSSYRPADGEWGAPQLIATGDIGDFDVDISDAGAAAVTWATDGISRKVYASHRPAGGTWEAAKELPGLHTGVLAVSGAGEVAVVGQNGLGADDPLRAFIRPPGQPWPVAGEPVPTPPSLPFSKTDGPNAVEYDGAGRLIVLDREGSDVEATVRSGGTWGATQIIHDGVSGAPGILDLARHPSGAVAAWRVGDDLHVARFNGAWDAPKVFAAGGEAFTTASVAADADGNIVVAATRVVGTAYEVWGATTTGIAAPWPGSTSRLSPAAVPGGRYYHDPAAGGGKYLVVAWTAHEGSVLASQAIATGIAPACGFPTPPPPDPTPTPDPGTGPGPQPQPQPTASPTATPAPKPAAAPKLGDFVKFGSCARKRKLAVTLKVPRGQEVTRIELRVNGKRAALRRAPKVAGRVTLRRLPKRFSLQATVTFKTGTPLKATRRLKAC
jgi:hypothetical protein